MADKIGVALIGYQFMGKAHSNAYRQVGRFFKPPLVPDMKVLCGRHEDAVRAAAADLGWSEIALDWHDVLKRDDIGIIDISSPGNTHKPIAIAAAEAGKNIFCEKPLGNSLDEAMAMTEAAEKAGVKAKVNFNYRYVPAVQLAKRLIDEGKLGQIYHYRGVYLQDWIIDPNFPLVWRLRKEVSGSGALGDIAAHNIDLARFLVGDVAEVAAADKTFIKERPLPAGADGAWGTAGGSQSKGEVTVDDAVVVVARFKSGALGTFEATRFAAGRRNYNSFEINGSKGSLYFNLERLNELQYFSLDDPDYTQGFKTIQVTGGQFKYADAWWPPAHIIGYEHSFVHSIFEFLTAIGENKTPVPDFRDGTRTQAVLETVAKAAGSRKWEPVPEF
jgi:predicted dehydrogenase